MSAADESFEVFARETTIQHCTRLGLVVIVAALAWWPLDALFFDDPVVKRAFVIWRAGTIVATALTILALRRLRPPFRGAHLIAIAGMCVDCAFIGYAGSTTGEFAERYLVAATFFPLASIMLLVRFPIRVLVTAALSASYLVPLLAPGTHVWEDQLLASQLSLVVFASLMSLVFGHTHHRLVARSHAQQVALDHRSRELEELDRLKNDFFANVSHELRTPLTLILAMLRELRATEDSDTRARVDTAERNAARLLVMIDELLELARFTGGRAEPKKRHVDLAELVRDVASTFRASELSGLTLAGCDEPLVAEVDPRQVRTAVHNLLSNAHKFTDPAARSIEVSLRAQGDGVEVAVTDNGIGIPPAAQGRVFERFFQVEAGRSRSRGGAGIGLALVRDIATAHGGEVRVESAVGRGSTFTIALPRGAAGSIDLRASYDDELGELHRLASAGPVPPPRAEISEIGETILIAEDDPELRAYLERLLGARYRVLGAANGEQALAALSHAVPALVVTDAMMPGTSGFDLVRQMRQRPSTRRIPALFLTARAGAAARAEAYEAGAEDFLSKPFDPEELLARVGNLLELRATERELAETNELLEQKVRERTAQLRELALHLEQSREDERRRIARDLHDETGQLLTALRMELDLARREPLSPGLSTILERMDGVLDQAFEATRALVGELRPRILDDLGLGAAAEWYLARFASRASLHCDAAIEPRDLTARPDASTAAFRILQEALTNVQRHSGARSVQVRLARSGDELELDVIDDGRGFDPKATRAGYGLLGMRERALALGGALEIESALGQGASLRLRLPAG